MNAAQKKLEAIEAQIALVEAHTALQERVRELARYLRSDKFAKDPTVQVVDVLTRLDLY
ncbi:hypothetical protein UFOVP75_16 [uncultured Caudovirales phage]|uniref:Uncharacterized protein n=1 Tax=uncultured Caudovirales phage TaxID=2100421 RepID=A0A6J5L044_9CAUD|nr:hypothetical protein UFOVP75_16 [uncultured Caudovirales phage]